MPQLRTERRIAGGTSVESDATVDWRSAAACLDTDPELFFPFLGSPGRPRTIVAAQPDPAAEARNVCRRCPVIRACLAEALTHDVTGVWGGTTEPERRALREEHGITAVSIMPRFVTDSPALMVHHMTGGGSSAREISEQIGMTPRTVVRYRRRINEGLTNDHHA